MNAYISYDGKKYATVAKNWQPQHEKPVTARYMADGTLDVSFGSGVIKMFKGSVVSRQDVRNLEPKVLSRHRHPTNR